jgi:hypothetical protein
VSLVQSDHVVEQLAAAAADPALRYSILPRTSNGGSHSCDLHRANGGLDFESVLRIVVEDEEPGNSIVRESLAQLLRDPAARRMPRDIAMQDAAAIMADDEEAVEHAERNSWDRKEVHGGYGFAVVA